MSAAATSLGNILRQERLRKELNLAAISRETRICTSILQAIEEDRFDGLPGGAYRRYFIRQYARALGRDGDEAVAEYRNQYQEAPLPLPVPPKTRPSHIWAYLAWTLAAVAGVVFAYHYLHTPHAGLNLAEPVVRRIETTHSTGSAARSAPESAPIPQAVVTPPATAPAPSLHVAFTATEPVWMSVRCDGNASYSGLLEVPQSKTFEASGTVTAIVGNAGGVSVWLNGKALGSLGAHGEVELIEVTLNGLRRIARRASSPSDQKSVPQL